MSIKIGKNGFVLLSVLLSVLMLVFLIIMYYLINSKTDLFSYDKVINITNTEFNKIKSKKTKKWGIENNNTKEIIIPVQYDKILYIPNTNLFKVKKDFKYNIINLKNETIFDKYIEEIILYTSNEDTSTFFIINYYIYNTKGVRLNPLGSFFNRFITNNYIEITNRDNFIDKFGVVDTLGNFVLPIEYFEIVSIEDTYVKVKKTWKDKPIKIKL